MSSDNFKWVPTSNVNRARVALAPALWCLLLLAASIAHAADPIIVVPMQPIAPPEGTLFGGLSDVTLAPTANGSAYFLKGRLTISNSGDKTAREVNATVAVYDDAPFNHVAIPTLVVANFRNGKGDVKPGRQVTITFRRKFSKRLAAALAGHDLFIFLSGEGGNGAPNPVIMYGPLPKI
jgi:hypothetical protein